MNFTIERKRLIKTIEHVRRELPGQKKKEKEMRLYVCAARVFVEANGITVGEETLVVREGGCRQPVEHFLSLLKSYPDKQHATVDADERALRLFSSTQPVSEFSREVKPPAKFVVGRITDTWAAGAKQIGAENHPTDHKRE